MSLPLFIALPLLGAFLIPILCKIWEEFGTLIANIISASLLALAIYGIIILPAYEVIVYEMGGWKAPLGIVLTFDSLSAFIVLCVNLLFLFCMVFSVEYIKKHYTAPNKFYTLSMLLLAGLNGISITGDLFNLFVFFEISAIASYALVAYGTESEELEAGFKYMVIGEIGSLVILLAIALLYGKTGTLNMADLANTVATIGKTPFFWLLFSLFLFGFFIKSAIFPFHFWLPDAHSAAPAPVSALLSGVFIKVLGVYAMSRLTFNLFGLTRQSAPLFFNLLIFLGVLAIIASGVTALKQRDYKRLLAYSSINQIGFIFVGLGIGNLYGITGALFAIISHALTKGLLALTAGAILYLTGLRDLEQLKERQMSFGSLGWITTISSISLSGIPPFLGFPSKLFLILGALSLPFGIPLVLVVVLLSGLTLAYLLRIINTVYVRKERLTNPGLPATMNIAMISLLLLLLAFGVSFIWVKDVIVGPAAAALLRGIDYAKFVL